MGRHKKFSRWRLNILMLLLQYTETLDMNDMVMVHGIPWQCGQGITEEKVEALTRLPAREDDFFIVSFPRSGSFCHLYMN